MQNSEDIPEEVLSSMLLKMFQFSPIAMSVSTSDGEASRYLLVNPAYLELTGTTWEKIAGRQLIKGAAIPSPGFERRHQTLREFGSYAGEEVSIRHTDGTVIPTLISCQRTIVNEINYDLEIIVDISERVREEHRQITRLLDMASSDALSGLPNRRAFEDQLGQYIAGSPPGSLVLAYLDLNGFKQLNDSLGHAAGDQAIRVISARLKGNKRPADFVARLGGDEFAIIFKGAPPISDEAVRSRFQRVMEPFATEGSVVTLGASVGLTVFRPSETAEEFVHRADQLMYQAKRQRRQAGVQICSDRSEPPAHGIRSARPSVRKARENAFHDEALPTDSGRPGQDQPR